MQVTSEGKGEGAGLITQPLFIMTYTKRYTDDRKAAWKSALEKLYAEHPALGADPKEMAQYDVTGSLVVAEHIWRDNALQNPENAVLYLTGTSVPIEEVQAIYALLFG